CCGTASSKMAGRSQMTGNQRRTAKKTVSHGSQQVGLFPRYFWFDSLARVCFLSVPEAAGHRMHGLFRWSSKWWPGVIPLLVFWAIAAWVNTTPLESDLAVRSTAALKDTVLDKTKIAVAG